MKALGKVVRQVASEPQRRETGQALATTESASPQAYCDPYDQSLKRMQASYPSLTEAQATEAWNHWTTALTKLSLCYPDAKLSDAEFEQRMIVYLESLTPRYRDPAVIEAAMISGPPTWRFFPTPGEVGALCNTIQRERAEAAARDQIAAERLNPRALEDRRPWHVRAPLSPKTQAMLDQLRAQPIPRVVSFPPRVAVPGDAQRAQAALDARRQEVRQRLHYLITTRGRA